MGKMTAKKINNRFIYFIFVLVTGQTMSFFFTGTEVFPILLRDHSGHNISITLVSGTYFVLSVTCGPCMALQKDFIKKLKANWWKFLFLGIVDAEGIYLQNMALKYTTISSSTIIINGAGLVSVVILSVFLIKTRYKFIHFTSMLICALGMVILILEDKQDQSDKNAGHDLLLGDVLSFAGGFTQSLSLVMEEFIIKGQLSVVEYMAMLGFGGAIVTSIQLCILERVSLVEMKWDIQSVLYFLGYNACNIGYYYLQPIVLIYSSSMAINLSTLTANVYSFMLAIFLFHNKFSMFYIGGFVTIMFGLVLYNVIPTPEGDTDQSVFSTSYWYNYGHSLFCEWKCICSQYDQVKTYTNDIDGHSTSDETKSLIQVNS